VTCDGVGQDVPRELRCHESLARKRESNSIKKYEPVSGRGQAAAAAPTFTPPPAAQAPAAPPWAR